MRRSELVETFAALACAALFAFIAVAALHPGPSQAGGNAGGAHSPAGSSSCLACTVGNADHLDAGTINTGRITITGPGDGGVLLALPFYGVICTDSDRSPTPCQNRISSESVGGTMAISSAANISVSTTEFDVLGPINGAAQAYVGVGRANSLQFTGADVGNPPVISVNSGFEPNVSLLLSPLGTGGVILGAGAPISSSCRGVTTTDLASVAAGSYADTTGITCTGAVTGAECVVGAPSSGGAAGSQFTCFVSAANTVTLRHSCNAGASACDPASATYSVRAFNP